MRRPLLILLAVVAATVVLGVLLALQHPGQSAVRQAAPVDATSRPSTLLLYCAAGIANPVTEVAKAYEREYGTTVEIQFGGSGTLLNNLSLAKRGDLYLAADTSYVEIALEKGLVDESIPLARLRPVIAVAQGNPKAIHAASDLSRQDVRVALANPEAASIGKWTKEMLGRLELWDTVSTAVRDRGVFKPTVNDVANDVKLGTVDAGIVWDATVRQKEYAKDLEAIEVEHSDPFIKEVTITVLHCTANPAAALHFARYLGAREKGLPVFARKGFTPVEGDAWTERPTILLYAGAVNRRAIQETLERFQQREGVEVVTVYNGCGILNGQIKLGEKPDAYQTCDTSFMQGLEDKFLPYQPISETEIVVLVKKGNPKSIRTLTDLSQPGLRLGLANEEQSALGRLTTRMLEQHGLTDAVRKNVVATTPTADMLVTQMRTGSLDAVVVYRANTTFTGDELEVIPLDDPLARAVQSFAVGKDSEHKQLVGRLLAALQTAESREHFVQAGFHFLESNHAR